MRENTERKNSKYGHFSRSAVLLRSEAYSEPCEIFKMKFFAKRVNDEKLLTLVAKGIVLDV